MAESEWCVAGARNERTRETVMKAGVSLGTIHVGEQEETRSSLLRSRTGRMRQDRERRSREVGSSVDLLAAVADTYCLLHYRGPPPFLLSLPQVVSPLRCRSPLLRAASGFRLELERPHLDVSTAASLSPSRSFPLCHLTRARLEDDYNYN